MEFSPIFALKREGFGSCHVLVSPGSARVILVIVIVIGDPQWKTCRRAGVQCGGGGGGA